MNKIYCSLLILLLLVLIPITRCNAEEGTSASEAVTSAKDIKAPLENTTNSSEGDTIEIIKVNSVAEEYDYISSKLGKRNVDWKLELQELVSENNKPYDLLTIKILSTNEIKKFKFDISSFF